MAGTYVYRFPSDIVREDVEGALVLAILATEGLHGEALTRLELRHHFDAGQRAVVVDGRSHVGEDFARILTSFLTRELTADGFSVQRVKGTRSAEDLIQNTDD